MAKRTVILVPTTNSHGKKDVTGAFLPEATSFAQSRLRAGDYVDTFAIDNTKGLPQRRAQAMERLKYLSAAGEFDCVAMFCHGWRDGVQHGFTRKTIQDLAGLPLSSDVVFALYCCSTGEDQAKRDVEAPGVGDGSFADVLRDALCAAGSPDCRVVAHTTVAHTTRNPHVVFFDGMGSSIGGVGGIAPVGPRHKLWRNWKAALQSTTDFRFRFPFMSIAQIHAELSQ